MVSTWWTDNQDTLLADTIDVFYNSVKTELDLGDRLEWIRVERDPALCELHNGYVGIIYGCLNFRKKSYVFVPLFLIYFMFLVKFCSYLEFDLTLDLKHRV
jgi:hypothetical protein